MINDKSSLRISLRPRFLLLEYILTIIWYERCETLHTLSSLLLLCYILYFLEFFFFFILLQTKRSQYPMHHIYKIKLYNSFFVIQENNETKINSKLFSCAIEKKKNELRFCHRTSIILFDGKAVEKCLSMLNFLCLLSILKSNFRNFFFCLLWILINLSFIRTYFNVLILTLYFNEIVKCVLTHK